MRIEIPDEHIVVEKMTDIRGRKRGYRARFFDTERRVFSLLEGQGNTEAEAKAALGGQVAKACAPIPDPTAFWYESNGDRGMMICYPTGGGGWGYSFYRPQGVPGRPHFVRSGGGTFGMGQDEALDLMRGHYYQAFIEPFVHALRAMAGQPYRIADISQRNNRAGVR